MAQENTSESGSPGQSKSRETSDEKSLSAQAQDALKSRNWRQAEDILKKLLSEYPTKWHYHKGLGDAQLYMGKYDDALASYAKGIELVSAAPEVSGGDKKKARDAAIGQMLVGEGKAYLKLQKKDEAFQHFAKAAAIDPNPGEAYFNLCSNCYKTGDMEHALLACDKAIEADPKKADAYFIKGSVQFISSSVDKNNRIVLPSGTTEALKKYLELAPEGSYSSDVKAMLKEAGIDMTNSHK
jgi:tetratricopeptide (TPR) repeat protein